MNKVESTKNRTPSETLQLGSRIVATGLLGSVLLSLPLWGLGIRHLPQVGLLPIPGAVDPILSGILILALLATIVGGLRRPWSLVILYSLTTLFLTDLARFRSFTFLYFCIFFTHTVAILRDEVPYYETVVRYWKWFIAMLYFWSGVHKLNATFLVRVGPFLLESIQQKLSLSTEFIILCSALIPLAELLLGVLLWFARTQKLAVLGLLGMHTFILLTLGPLDKNISQIVWPWNITMCGLLCVLFLRTPKTLTINRTPGDAMLLIVFFLLPAFHVFDRWNGELSFNMFSGRVPEVYIYPEKGDQEAAPKHLRHVIKHEGGIDFIDLNAYALDDIKVLAFEEPFALRIYTESLCKQLPESKVIIKQPPPLFSLEPETLQTSCPVVLSTINSTP